MTADDNARIASLTTGAIKTTTEAAIDAMMKAVEAAEEKTREMRVEVEKYIAEFRGATEALAGNVNMHVESCQAAIESFQAHHLKILQLDPPPAQKPKVEPDMQRLQDELNKQEAVAPSLAGGRT